MLVARGRRVAVGAVGRRGFASASIRRALAGRRNKGGADTDRFNRVRFQAAVFAGLGGLTLTAWFYGYAKKGSADHEYVWASPRRGPLAIDAGSRAFASGPVAACLGSAGIATIVATFFKHRIPLVAIGEHLHTMMGFPLAILVAFRFQASHDRWWAARNQVENIAAKAISVSVCSATSVDRMRLKRSDSMEAIENEARLLGLVDALLYFIEEHLMDGEDPHPSNAPDRWDHGTYYLSLADREDGHLADNKVLWCVDRIVDCIMLGNAQGSFSSELTAEMNSQVQNLVEAFRQATIVVCQREPASYIVHMRTFLYGFCLSYPWSIIGTVSPAALIPVQFIVSWSLLGIEFCAREMDYPFGDDAGDLPCRKILAEVRKDIDDVRKRHLGAYLQMADNQQQPDALPASPASRRSRFSILSLLGSPPEALEPGPMEPAGLPDGILELVRAESRERSPSPQRPAEVQEPPPPQRQHLQQQQQQQHPHQQPAPEPAVAQTESRERLQVPAFRAPARSSTQQSLITGASSVASASDAPVCNTPKVPDPGPAQRLDSPARPAPAPQFGPARASASRSNEPATPPSLLASGAQGSGLRTPGSAVGSDGSAMASFRAAVLNAKLESVASKGFVSEGRAAWESDDSLRGG